MALAVFAAVPVARADHAAEFRDTVAPLMQKYCVECHNEKKAKGDLDLTRLDEYGRAVRRAGVWENVRKRVDAHEMPPEGADMWSEEERGLFLGWIQRIPRREIDCSQLATDQTQGFYSGHVMSRRLTREEYDRTVRDLTGLDLGLGKNLPADGAGGEGFDTTGDTLFTSPLGIEKYLEAAEVVTTAFLREDDAALSESERAARARFLIAEPADGLPARDAAQRVLERFLPLAFRRPVEAGELEKYLALYDRRAARGEGFLSGLRLAVRGVLVSPHFLFLVEPEPEGAGTQPLGPYPLASRLSYFLWSSMPDEELFHLATSGEIVRDDVIVAQVRRMLQDPRADSLGERFLGQWLELDKLGTEIKPDPARYPEFDVRLAAAMRGEAIAFFNHLVRENKPLTRLLDAPYSFLNETMARHYGVPGVEGEAFRRVSLPRRERGGLLGMAAVHTLTSFPLRTSPVLRGRWILDTLLGDKIPPPPPDIPALKEDGHALSAASLREQLEIHRKNPECSSCHNKMDPLGFGMESFDVLGRFRTEGVDAQGTLPSGESFNGPAEMKQVLLKRRDPILRHMMRRLTGYALGRSLNRFDTCIINDAMKALAENEDRPQRAIEAIALSLPFRHRYYAVDQTAAHTSDPAPNQ